MRNPNGQQCGGEGTIPPGPGAGPEGAGCALTATAVRRRLEVRGRVQGVGFRPFVFRLASDLGLVGFVGNDMHGAFVEVEGDAAAVARFTDRLQSELPELAQITSFSARDVPAVGERAFRIEPSSAAGRQEAEIAPDAATCEDCLRELFDPGDRRYRYPFINCTNCGPRYSIIRGVPYDRPNTTMSKFTMCPACRAEYDDPADRRFHAQPNACGECGPRAWLAGADGTEIAGDAIRLAAGRLGDGRIVAVKGLGGFHLACRADDDQAVARLRRRKAREAKPLAVMVASIEAARRLVDLDLASAAALTGPTRPIVLAPKRPGAPISGRVAPGSDCFGVMLPYTPLHALLFAEGLAALVMTSGNPSEEPLCRDNDEAIARLGSIVDALLLHDRDIERRVDDSVVKTTGDPEGTVGPASAGRPAFQVLPMRRARGFVPAPIAVPDRGVEPVLATGAELKSTVCLLAGGSAVVSEHLGELSNPAASRNFVAAIECFERLLRLEPRVVACDMHPDYAATRYALELPLPATAVQHHHAHVVSCMADNGIAGEVVGISCDGTGYGPDGAIWGCEVMVCDEADFERAGHLRYFPLVGGDAAARETWRPAAGLLHQAFGPDWRDEADFALRRVDPQAMELTARLMAAAGPPTTRTSSLGRLFDAAAFLLGVRDRNHYEAEAPMALEAVAARCAPCDPLEYSITGGDDGRPMQLDAAPTVRALVQGARSGRPAPELARAFHETVAAMLAECAARTARRTGLRRTVLSGGCFANRILLERLSQRLRAGGHEVFVHRQVPTGDGGVSLGQAVAAAERLSRGILQCV